MKENGFVLLNGRTIHDRPANFTFFNTNGRSSIDFVWCNASNLSSICDLQVLDSNLTSDHFPVQLSIFGGSDIGIAQEDVIKTNSVKKMIWLDSARDDFLNALSLPNNIAVDSDCLSVDELYELKLAFTKAASECGLLKSFTINSSNCRRGQNFWMDTECKELRSALNCCRRPKHVTLLVRYVRFTMTLKSNTTR